MSGAIQGVLNGALIQEMRLNVLANNISNINTVGFKEDKMFRVDKSSGSKNESPKDSLTSGTLQVSSVGLPVGTFTNFSQGKIIHTGNRLDLALEGDGFFCVQTPWEVQYTRKGNFTLNMDGVLVTQDGLPVIGKAGKIQIDSQNIVVDTEGNIVQGGNIVDTIKIVDFPQPHTLQKAGSNLFATADPGGADTRPEGFKILQGFVEQSNVDAVNVMTEMIDVLRGYESYQKVIQSLNDTTLKAINDVGRLA